MTPQRDADSPNVVDYYQYRTGTREQRFTPRQIIHFRYPDPRNPYTGGLSPLRACYEQVALLGDFAAMKKAIYENNAIPAAIVSPEEVIGEEERDRLEVQWNQKFRRGGSGRVLVGESGLKVQVLSHSMGDLAALADMRATKEDIANAFHVPLSFLTSNTNLANLQAAEHQHQAKAIAPRLRRRDEKLNEQLLPLFDPSGRLFVASDDPVPANRVELMQQQESDLKFGVITINEVRQNRGLPPVPWGDTPWLPLQWAPTDYDRAAQMPDIGRNRKPSTNGKAERGTGNKSQREAVCIFLPRSPFPVPRFFSSVPRFFSGGTTMSAIAVTGNTTTAVQANFSFYKGEDVAITDR